MMFRSGVRLVVLESRHLSIADKLPGTLKHRLEAEFSNGQELHVVHSTHGPGFEISVRTAAGR